MGSLWCLLLEKSSQESNWRYSQSTIIFRAAAPIQFVIACGIVHIFKSGKRKRDVIAQKLTFLAASWNQSTTEIDFWVNYSNKRRIIDAALMRAAVRYYSFCPKVRRLFEGGANRVNMVITIHVQYHGP